MRFITEPGKSRALIHQAFVFLVCCTKPGATHEIDICASLTMIRKGTMSNRSIRKLAIEGSSPGFQQPLSQPLKLSLPPPPPPWLLKDNVTSYLLYPTSLPRGSWKHVMIKATCDWVRGKSDAPHLAWICTSRKELPTSLPPRRISLVQKQLHIYKSERIFQVGSLAIPRHRVSFF